MRFGESKRRQAAYSRLRAEVAGNDAVRGAEEIVGDHWLVALADAEQETAAAQRICTHMRDTAYQVVRAADRLGPGREVPSRRGGRGSGAAGGRGACRRHQDGAGARPAGVMRGRELRFGEIARDAACVPRPATSCG